MSVSKPSVLKIAPPYDDDLISRIEQGFSNMLNDDVQFRVVEDPSLLSGFIAYIHGTVYDVSGKTQLTGIKEYLVDSVVMPPPIEEEEDDS
jgi:F0F1-type ATP synthase, delta subunit (mitochondrial oligomycin sensitivity protein)